MKRVYIIAEAGVNHEGSLENALELVDIAQAAGADAVKFQTFEVEKIVSVHASRARYQRVDGEPGDQRSLLKSRELSRDAHRKLVQHCRRRNITFLSSAFDIESLQFLISDCEIPKIKIASGEITHFPMLVAAGRSQLPTLLSTGMSESHEIQSALTVLAYAAIHPGEAIPARDRLGALFQRDDIQSYLRRQVTLLHCTSEYPTPPERAQLQVMDDLSSTFQLPVGFSDHTLGIAVALGAVARGARVIEKHFTIDRELSGPDQAASLKPRALKEMIDGIRNLEKAIGDETRRFSEIEIENRHLARRSLFARTAITRGEIFNETNVCCLRPAIGISADQFGEVIGKRSLRAYAAGEVIER